MGDFFHCELERFIKFLGVAAGLQQKIQTDLLAAWAKLPAPAVTLDAFRNPVGLKLPNGLSTHQAGIVIGWGTALCVYLALGHMTFRYRWPSRYDLPVE